jgi:hypothetical protein
MPLLAFKLLEGSSESEDTALKSVPADKNISYYALSRKENLETLGSAKALTIMLFDMSSRWNNGSAHTFT